MESRFAKIIQVKPRFVKNLSPQYQPFRLPERTEFVWTQSPMVRIYNALRNEATKRGLNPDEIKYGLECECCCGDDEKYYDEVEDEDESKYLTSVLFGDEARVDIYEDVKNPIRFASTLNPEDPKLRVLLDVLIANEIEVLEAFQNQEQSSGIINFIEKGAHVEEMRDTILKSVKPTCSTEMRLEYHQFLSELKPEVLLAVLFEPHSDGDSDDD